VGVVTTLHVMRCSTFTPLVRKIGGELKFFVPTSRAEINFAN